MPNKAFRQVKVDSLLDGSSAESGRVQALFSVFNEIDADGDVLLASFFSDGQEIPMAAWGHVWDVPNAGKGVIRVTPRGAVFDGQFNLNTSVGRDTYETVKFNAGLQEWSFGYRVIEQERGQLDGQPANFLKLGETYEACPVLVGANRNTATLGLKASWTAAYINNLPDSAFAYIEPGGEKDEDGKTTPRSLRHLPHHNAQGSVDLPHVRNALSRAPQADIPDAAKTKAESHLQKHLDDAKKGIASDHSHKGIYVDEPPEGSYEDLAEDIAEAMTAQGIAGQGAYVSTLATFPTYAYVCVCDYRDPDMDGPDYYRVDYSLNDQGDPVLSNPTEVEPGVVFTAIEQPGLQFAGHAERALAAVRGFGTRTKALAAARTKEGRVLSAANHRRLTDVADGMQTHIDAMRAVLLEAAPPEKAATTLQREIMRFLAEEARRNGVAFGA